MRAFGEVLEEQRAVIAQHVGFQRQQTVLTHQSGAQVGHGGGLERVLLLGGQGLVDVAGLPPQQRLLHAGVGVRPLHPAVRAAGLRPGPVGACGREDAVRDTGKLYRDQDLPHGGFGKQKQECSNTRFGFVFHTGVLLSPPFSCLAVGGFVFPARSLLPHQLGSSSVPHAVKAGQREGMCILPTTWIRPFISLKLRFQDSLLVLKLHLKV